MWWLLRPPQVHVFLQMMVPGDVWTCRLCHLQAHHQEHRGCHSGASWCQLSAILSCQRRQIVVCKPHLASSQTPCGLTHYSLRIGSSLRCQLSAAWGTSITCMWSYYIASQRKNLTIDNNDRGGRIIICRTMGKSQSFIREIEPSSQQITPLHWPLTMCDLVIDIPSLMLILASG